VFQALILALWATFCIYDTLGPTFIYAGRPLIAGTVAGAIVGDPTLGLAIGGTLELTALGVHSGSPGNAVASAFLRDEDVEMVTGLNLPMVLEVSNRRKKAGGDVAALKGYAVAAGTAGVVDVGEKLGL